MSWQDQSPGTLLAGLDPAASRAERHLWLIGLIDWLRGPAADVPATLKRIGALLDAAEADADWLARWRLWWQRLRQDVDLAPLLADFGFASQSAFMTELGHRIRHKLLPSSPVTTDIGELFCLLFHDPLDARWLGALTTGQLERLGTLLAPDEPPADGRGADSSGLSDWEQTLIDALSFCIGQISATGFRPELRSRMSIEARQGRSFLDLPMALENFRRTAAAQGVTSAEAQARLPELHRLLDQTRQAAYSVYAHLEEHGISVGIVFRLRQLRERVLRATTLLDCLLSEQRPRTTARFIAQLVQVGHESRSIRALVASSTQLTAARVAERSAESGEHYITRTWDEYRDMLLRAGGGGAVLGFTTWFKFLLGGLALSAFWSGLAAGLNYALAFVLIQLLHLTVATKQPAVTAPAMVAKLRDLRSREGVLRFVDEVAHLFRSQVAAIIGNLALVIPVGALISTALWLATGAPMLTPEKARHVLDSHQLLGPTLLFAAMTGLLLFASSIVAGWVENWFVLHKLDSALAYHPTITRRLGQRLALGCSRFMRTHVSGLAANLSLGLMLGLVPAGAGFFGLELEVRHVTLVMGQLTAAAMALGWTVWLEPAFWSALAAMLLVGPINLAVSFYLAFRLALKARSVSDINRQRIQDAIRHRLRRAPLSFLWPVSAQQESPADSETLIAPSTTHEDEPPDGRV